MIEAVLCKEGPNIVKGGSHIMRYGRTIVVMFPLLTLALFLMGCPKGSVTGLGTTGAVSVAANPGVGLTADGRMLPPSPSEFVAAPELKDIHFDFDRYDVRPGDAKILEANAKWIKASPNMLVLVEGHADERGTNEYNLALGERRAKATMTYLVAQGVAAYRLTLISYGEERPVCADHNEGCWTENRRGHFLVKPR